MISLIISLLLIIELLLTHHLFAYYVVVVLKTIVFIFVFKFINITVNGFFAFPLMQIGKKNLSTSLFSHEKLTHSHNQS